MEATPTEQQSTHSVPRFDRDIRERPRSTSSGVSFTGAGIAGRRRAQPVGRSEAASHSTALPLTPELATNDGWSVSLGDDEDDPRRSRAGSTSTLLEAPTGRASGRRSHPAEGEAAHHSGALPLSPELAVDNRQNPCVSHAENMQRNRFAGSEFCGECDLPFSDSNYVANTFEGHSYCGDCWDAYLGITIVIASNLHPSTLCGCGRDLHAEPWFTVDLAAQQTPYCRACALSYWGMRGSEFAVTIINDGGNAMGSLHGDDGSYRLQQQVLSTAPLFPGLLHWIILSPEVAHHTHISRQSTAVTTGTLRARRLLHHSPPLWRVRSSRMGAGATPCSPPLFDYFCYFDQLCCSRSVVADRGAHLPPSLIDTPYDDSQKTETQCPVLTVCLMEDFPGSGHNA